LARSRIRPTGASVASAKNFGEFRQDRILHLRRDELQNVVKQGALALAAGGRGFEKEVGDFAQQLTALIAVGRSRQIDKLCKPRV
jgi:hypothetical protein